MSEEILTTRQKIEKVIEGLEEADALHLISISYVAREVGVTGPNIHNRYKDLAKRINALSGNVKNNDAKAKLLRQKGSLKAEREKRARVRLELIKTKELLRKADSVNASLQFENDRLSALVKDYLKKMNLSRSFELFSTTFASPDTNSSGTSSADKPSLPPA